MWTWRVNSDVNNDTCEHGEWIVNSIVMWIMTRVKYYKRVPLSRAAPTLDPTLDPTSDPTLDPRPSFSNFPIPDDQPTTLSLWLGSGQWIVFSKAGPVLPSHTTWLHLEQAWYLTWWTLVCSLWPQGTVPLLCYTTSSLPNKERDYDNKYWVPSSEAKPGWQWKVDLVSNWTPQD